MNDEQNNQPKTRIYNLIILDKSGSMGSIRKAAYEGCNEVLNGIRAAAEKYADQQEQFVSLLLFDTKSMPYIHQCTPASQVTNLKKEQYCPCACTPLLDAMGKSLLELEQETSKYEDAVGMVTVITDGYENASREFSYAQIQELVGRLKSKGWNFAFMGANQDIHQVCADLNINEGNARAFSFDEAGMTGAWNEDRLAKERYYARMRQAKIDTQVMTELEREAYYCQVNYDAPYFEDSDQTSSTNDTMSDNSKQKESLLQKLFGKKPDKDLPF